MVFNRNSLVNLNDLVLYTSLIITINLIYI